VVNEHASSPAALKLADQLQKITNLVAVLGFGGASTGDAPSFASAFKLAKIRALEIFRHMNRWMDTIGHSTVMQPGNSLLDNGITL
jgi:hypothetical protein